MPESSLLGKLRTSGLLLPEELAGLESLPEAREPDPRRLGQALVERGLLTAYQLELIEAGRGRELRVERYLLLERLGEGAMGQVFKARHQHMERVVALKLIRKEKLANANAVKRFYQEVKAAGQLQHPNIVMAFDAGPAGSTHFFSMEYVEGTDLSKLVKEWGPLPVPVACDYIRQAALGLQHAHERGLIHRDIKPSNLLVAATDNGAVVKILDMGLARLLDESSDRESVPGALPRQRDLTCVGQLIGTPDYVAPEQARDARQVDARADLYSLGCSLFYLLTGKAPFQAPSLTALLHKHLTEDPPSLRQRRPEAPAALDALVQRLLAKKPEGRPQSAAEVAQALEPFCGSATAPALFTAPPLPPPVAPVAPAALPPLPPARSFVELGDRPTRLRPARKPESNTGLYIAVFALLGLVLIGGMIVAAVAMSRAGRKDADEVIVDKDDPKVVEPPEKTVVEPEKPRPKDGGKPKDKDRGKTLVKGGAPDRDKAKSKDSDPPKDKGKAAVLVAKPSLFEKDGPHELLKFHGRPVLALAVSKDGKLAATGGEDAELVVWDLDKRVERLRIKELPGPVSHLIFSADARRLMASINQTLYEWELATPRKLGMADRPGDLLSPDLETAVIFEPGVDQPQMRALKASDGTEQAVINAVDVLSVRAAFQGNDRVLAVGDKGAVQVFDLVEKTVVRHDIPRDDGAEVRCVIGGNRKEELLAGLTSGAVVLASLDDHLKQRTIGAPHRGEVLAVALSPDGKQVLSGGADRILRLSEYATGKPLGQFEGQTAPIHRIVFFADGRRAITSAHDGSVRLWDLTQPTSRPAPAPPATGLPGEVYRVEGGVPVVGCFFAPDGKRALFARGESVFVYEPEARRAGKALVEEPDRITALAVSADFKRLLTAGADRKLRLYEADSGKLLKTLSGHESEPTCVAFSPDGKWALSGGGGECYKDGKKVTDGDGKPIRGDFAVRLWNLETGGEAGQFAGPADTVTGVAFSPDGKQVLAASLDRPLRAWGVASHKEASPAPRFAAGQEGSALALAGKRHYLLAGNDVVFWDAVKQSEVRRFAGHKTRVYGLAVAVEPGYLLTVGGEGPKNTDCALRVWDFGKDAELRTVELPAPGRCVAVTPDGKAALVGTSAGTLYHLDLARLMPPGRFMVKAKVNSLAVSADGKHLLTGGEDKFVRLWDVETGKVLRRMSMSGALNTVRFTRTAKMYFAAGENRVNLAWNMSLGAEVRRLSAGRDGMEEDVVTAAMSPDGEWYQLAAGTTLFNLHAPNPDKVTRKRHTADGRVLSITSLGQRALFVYSTDKGTIRLWDAFTEKAGPPVLGVPVVKGPFVPVTVLAYHPKTQRLVVGGRNGLILLRGVGAAGFGAPRVIGKHESPVTSLAFSADGKRLVSGGKDWTVRVWDAASTTTGSRLLYRFTEKEAINDVAFLSDRQVVSAGNGIRVWDLAVKPVP